MWRCRSTAGLGLEDEFAVSGSFVAGPRRCSASPGTRPPTPTIARWWLTARHGSPTRPIRGRAIASSRFCGARDRACRARRLARPDLAGSPAAYWRARDRFIARAGTCGRRRPAADAGAGARAAAGGPAHQPGFPSGYDPLLAMAADLARSDVSGARALLTALAEIQPGRDEAKRTLEGSPSPRFSEAESQRGFTLVSWTGMYLTARSCRHPRARAARRRRPLQTPEGASR